MYGDRAGGQLDDVRGVFGKHRRRQPEEQEDHNDDRQPTGAPLLSDFLDEQDTVAPHPWAPGGRSLGTSRRKTSSRLGRSRSKRATWTPLVDRIRRISGPAREASFTATRNRGPSRPMPPTKGDCWRRVT